MSGLISKDYILKEKIYDFICGQTDGGELPDFVRGKVKDEFAEGSRCAFLYDQMCAAEIRILDRLGTDDDEDLEIIMQTHSIIERLIALKMYDYGVEFSKEN